MWKRTVFKFALGSLALLCAACGDDAGRESPDVGAMAAVPAAPARVIATGRVEGWREADVTSKLPGRIVRFEYEEGDGIEAGAPVVRLEDRDLRARLRGAEARAAEAARSLRRTRALSKKGFAASSDLDRAESTYLTSSAELDEARVMLDYATIKAPFGGTLVRKFKEVGESVSVSSGPDPLFRLADLSRLKVTAEVPEGDIAAIGAGQEARVSADAYPSERFPATVQRVGLAVGRKRLRSDDPRERLDEKVIEVELELMGNTPLKSGMTVDIVFAIRDG
jgi:RND family efflux transporter MFP subunit